MSEPEQALPQSHGPRPSRLKEAVREARIEAAERTGVVVDLRDAELARLELLNDALDPVFEDVPPNVELFDRGMSRGDQPRLWIDMIAHVAMGRDKRTYRFLQDSRFGRRILAESTEIPVIVDAVTRYIARRLVERDRQLSGDETGADSLTRYVSALQRGRRWRGFALFVLGALIGIVALLAAAWFLDPFNY
ncbi:MAG: hypothetical protein AB7K64_14245 [Variibacter sp.]